MNAKRIFSLITTLFWLLVVGLIALDTLNSRGSRVEPPPIALGSGQAAGFGGQAMDCSTSGATSCAQHSSCSKWPANAAACSWLLYAGRPSGRVMGCCRRWVLRRLSKEQ